MTAERSIHGLISRVIEVVVAGHSRDGSGRVAVVARLVTCICGDVFFILGRCIVCFIHFRFILFKEVGYGHET